MKTCVCDVCGQSLPMNNQLNATILGVALDLCPDCQVWANGISREDMVMIMLEGFRVRRKSNGVRGMDGGPSSYAVGPRRSNSLERVKVETAGPPPTPGMPAQEVIPPVSDPENKPITGPGAALKRDTLKALEEYRRAHGAGCWVALAESAGVTPDQIAQVRMRQKVPMEVWRSLAEALGVEHKEVS